MGNAAIIGAMLADPKTMLQWTVYHPEPGMNCPTGIRWLINTAYHPEPVCDTFCKLIGPLPQMEAYLARLGFTKLMPSPDDDPSILAVWI